MISEKIVARSGLISIAFLVSMVWAAHQCSPDALADVTPPTSVQNTYTGFDFNRNGIYKLLDLYLADSSGNTMRVNAPSLADDNTVFTLPADNGTNGFFLGTDGSGATSWAAIPSSSGINYIDNFDFELTADAAAPDGWAADKDGTPGETPTDTTGTASGSVTFLGETLDPLIDLVHADLYKPDSVNYQGEMKYYPFTIDNQFSDYPKVFKVKFFYTASANFDFGDSSNPATDPSDVIVYVYEGTWGSGSFVQPVNFVLDGSGVYEGTFQPTAGESNYSLVLYVTDDSTANDWTLSVDNVQVGPQEKIYGPVVTEWKRQDDLLTTTWDTYFDVKEISWRRVGDNLEAVVYTHLDDGAATGNYDLQMPSGLNIDTDKLTSAETASSLWGAITQAAGNRDYDVHGSVLTATTIRLRADQSGGRNISATYPIDWASGDYVNYRFSVPIQGWGGTTLLSSEAAGRVVAARFTDASGQAVTDTNTISWNTVAFDTHAGFDGTDTWTVPVSGYYAVTVNMGSNSVAASLGNYFSAYVYKNASIAGQAGAADFCANTGARSYQSGGSVTMYAAAGDTISARFSENIPAVNLQSNANLNFMEIKRIEGPQSIAASEVVAAKYRSDAGASYTNGQTIVYEDRIKDTHNAYNTSTGVYTCPVSGWYHIAANSLDPAFGGPNSARMGLEKDTTLIDRGPILSAPTTGSYSISIATSEYCEAGGQFEIIVEHNETNWTQVTTASWNNLAIHRIGGGY